MSEPQFIAKMQELTNKSKVVYIFMTSITDCTPVNGDSCLKNRDVNVRT